MGRRTILERVHQEAKLGLGALFCEAQYLEHLVLQLCVMDTERATAHFNAIADKIVSLGTHLLGMLVEQWDVVGIGHGEGMVGGHQALLLIAPFKEREVDNPQALEHILVAVRGGRPSQGAGSKVVCGSCWHCRHS